MVMEDYNVLDDNQRQLMKRAPTLVTGPNLVFLAPTKKGLRNPIIKCKIQLASLSLTFVQQPQLNKLVHYHVISLSTMKSSSFILTILQTSLSFLNHCTTLSSLC